ncbi:MAG: hypothetical protein II689_01125 [Firmicutes bacterium]|nr:hypothetical protein [Bacillota bacterium]
MIEVYAWNDNDDGRAIKINQFKDDELEKARNWLRNAKTTNKILAVGPAQMSKARTFLWGGK